VRGGAAHRWALCGRIHAGGDGRRTACEYAGAVGVLPATIRMSAIRTPPVAAPDQRRSGGFTPEVTVAARHANTPGLSV